MSRFSKTDVAMMVMALVYILVPVDFIPELITGPLGLTDDLAATAMIAAILLRSRKNTPTPQPAENFGYTYAGACHSFSYPQLSQSPQR